MPGTYSVPTRASGSILTATIYNSDHGLHITYNTPGGCDDASATVTQMQATADPGEVGTESLATDLLGELQRLRHLVKEITGKTYWYETPDSALSTIFNKGADIASATTLIPVGEWRYADVTGSVTINGINTEPVGKSRTFRFTGAPLLTHNATSFILPGGANYQVVAGQVITFYSLGSGNWFMGEVRMSGSYRLTSSGGKTGTFIHANTVDRNYTFQDSNHVVVGRDTTDELTNKSFNAQGTGNSLTNVSTSALKTSTGAATHANNADTTITMNDYGWFPSCTTNSIGNEFNYLTTIGNTADPSNTIGRFISRGGTSGDTTTYRWRYVTASDEPTIWVMTDAAGNVVGTWVSDDPPFVMEDRFEEDPETGLTVIRKVKRLLAEPPIRSLVPGIVSRNIPIAMLANLAISKKALDSADLHIDTGKLKPENRLYRALQMETKDAAPSGWIFDNCKFTGNELRPMTAQEKAAKKVK